MYGHQIRTLAHSYKKIINKFLKKTISKLINTVFRCSYQEHTCIFRRYILMSAVKSCGDLVVSIIGKEEGNIQFTLKKKIKGTFELLSTWQGKAWEAQATWENPHNFPRRQSQIHRRKSHTQCRGQKADCLANFSHLHIWIHKYSQNEETH